MNELAEILKHMDDYIRETENKTLEEKLNEAESK